MRSRIISSVSLGTHESPIEWVKYEILPKLTQIEVAVPRSYNKLSQDLENKHLLER